MRHSKRRGGRIVDTIEDQTALELETFVLPASASAADLLPLQALASPELSCAALTQAVRRGRLRAVRRSGAYYSTRPWVEEYAASRRGR